jgi:two-component system, cell cycle response regulator CpdR
MFLKHLSSDFIGIGFSRSGQPMARILLAEPDRAIRDFIAGILAEFGHDVQVCGNGVDANVWLATAPFDVLVTDMVLRGRQGLRLSQHSASLGVPTVTLTGREFHAARAGETQPLALLEKPFRFADLQRVLNAVNAVKMVQPVKAVRHRASSAA